MKASQVLSWKPPWLGYRKGRADEAGSWMLCLRSACARTRPDTHVLTHEAGNTAGPNGGLTHAGDSVIREVADFTLTLETTGNVGTFLVASGWKFRIGALVDVCAVTGQQASARRTVGVLSQVCVWLLIAHFNF